MQFAKEKLVHNVTVLFEQVHQASKSVSTTHELRVPLSILQRIRAKAFEIMSGSNAEKYRTYYLGLSLYLLAALKYKNLDKIVNKAPRPKQIAFLVACLSYHYTKRGLLGKIFTDDLPLDDAGGLSNLPAPTQRSDNNGKKRVLFGQRSPNLWLHAEIDQAFNVAELRELCHEIDIEIDYENLAGEMRSERALSLIQYCKRHGAMDELLAYCQQKRPSQNWYNMRY